MNKMLYIVSILGMVIYFFSCSEHFPKNRKVNSNKDFADESYQELKWRGKNIVLENCSGCHGRGNNDNYGTSTGLYDMYKDSVNLKKKIYQIMNDSTHKNITTIKDSTDAISCYYFIKDIYNPKYQ